MISFYVYKYIFIAVFRAVLRVSLKINRMYTYIAINRGTLISGQSTPCTIIIHIVGKIKTVLVTRQVSHSLSLSLSLPVSLHDRGARRLIFSLPPPLLLLLLDRAKIN